MRGRIRRKDYFGESTEREITSIQDKAPLLYNDYCKMLDRRDLDIVLIAVSKEEQDKFFLKACEYDKNIYIEISQCLSPEEIQPLVDATHRMSGVVQVGCSSLGVNNMIARIKDFLSFLSGLKDKTSYPIESACLSGIIRNNKKDKKVCRLAVHLLYYLRVDWLKCQYRNKKDVVFA